MTSPNVLVFGTVGSGKSSFVKTVCVIRPLLLQHRRAVVFDKKDDGGRGRVRDLTRRLGAEPLRFTADTTGTRLNLLDPLIARGSGIKGVIPAAGRDHPRRPQRRRPSPSGRRKPSAPPSARMTRHRAAPAGRRSRRTCCRTSAASSTTPTTRSSPPAARDQLHRAGLSVRWALTGLLDEYAGLLDGETSRTRSICRTS